MNSVNSAIERLTRQGALSGMVAAYGYAALLVAGPWIFTALGLVSLGSAECDGTCAELTAFRSVVIYNSMFALIISSPLAFAAGRYASEQMQGRGQDTVFAGLVLALAAYAAIAAGVAAPFYLFATTLDSRAVVASIVNVMLLGCSWLLIPFLGAMRAYRSVLIAFGAGAAAMFAFGWALRDPKASEFLAAFDASFALIDFLMLVAVVRRFGAAIVFDPDLNTKIGDRWELPAAGAAYALGLWADKVIMWRSGSPGTLVVAGALRTMPGYDAAMFWAQLSSIPVIAVFFVHVETRFTTLVHAYHQRLQQNASLRELDQIARRIATHVTVSLFGLFGALIVFAGMMILLSFIFMAELGLKPSYMGIFRISLCAMAFYTSAMFCFSFLLHLDLRRSALTIVVTFVVLNIAITIALLPLGSDFYGYGNMIAATATLLVGFRLVTIEMNWIHYHNFITNNPSA